MDHVEKLDGPWGVELRDIGDHEYVADVVDRDGWSHATVYTNSDFHKADYMAAAPEMYDLIAKLANSKIDLVFAEAKAREIVSKIKAGDYRT